MKPARKTYSRSEPRGARFSAPRRVSTRRAGSPRAEARGRTLKRALRRVLRGCIFATAALAAVCAAAQTAPPRPAASPAPVRRPVQAARPGSVPSVKDLKFPALKPIPIPEVAAFTLANGMKVYLLEDRELPMISGAALIRTGNLFDPPGKTGLATLAGMVIRTGGTKSKTGDQWNEELENLAASVESRIDETAGTVSFSALKENADAVMAIFKDALTAPEFRQDKLDLAKAQLRGGIARRNDDAQRIAEREFTGIVYGKDTPYGSQDEYSTIGRVARRDLQDFHKRYFFPKSVLLAVWGDFETAAMKTKVEQLFADWTVEQPPAPPFPKVRTQADPGTYLAVKKDLTQTFFAVGQLGGEIGEKDYPALVVMADILGGGFRGRLFRRVRATMGSASQVGADWSAGYDHPGLFRISGSTKSLTTIETIRAIREEVERIRSAEVTDEELAAAKNTALNSLVFAYDTKTKTLGRMLTYEYYGYPKDFIQQYQKALAAVTRADVLRVAKERLDPASFAIVAVGNPQGFGRPLDSLGGPVNPIDLTIPGPEAAPPDTAGMAKGKQMLERAQQAAGGADRLAAIQDFTLGATVDVEPAAGGTQGKWTIRWLAPGVYRRDQETRSARLSLYLNGRSGWTGNQQGSGPPTGAQLTEMQGDVFRLYFRLLLSDRVEGRTVNGVAEDTIEIAEGAGQFAQLTIDPASGMPRGVRYNLPQTSGAPAAMEDLWSDFREIGGVKIPYKTTITSNGQKFAELTVTDCKINSGLKQEELQKRP